jgi:hypothetical protein
MSVWVSKDPKFYADFNMGPKNSIFRDFVVIFSENNILALSFDRSTIKR